MATPITNTETTTQAVGEREDLADLIAKVDPVSTPVYSNCAKTTAKNPTHQWQEWKIRSAPVPPNYKSEGEEPDRDAVTATGLINNQTSIFSRDYTLSNTLTAVDTAGDSGKKTWARITQGLELRQEVETAILANTGKKSTQPRHIGGLPAWAGGANGGTPSLINTPASTPTALNTAMANLYDKGIVGRTVLMTVAQKAVFSGTAITPEAVDVETSMYERVFPDMWSGAVSLYMTDYGAVQMVVDRYMDADEVPIVMDDRHVKVAEMTGRAFKESVLGQTGDAAQVMQVWEGTTEVGTGNAIELMGTTV